MRYLFVVPAWLLLFSALARAQAVEHKIDSYLYEPSYQLDNLVRGQARAYVPQPGDVLLATDVNWFWSLTHNIAGAGEPHN